MVHCTLQTVNCTLHTTHYSLQTARYTLNTAHYTLHNTQYTLHTTQCIMHTAPWYSKSNTLKTRLCTVHTEQHSAASTQEMPQYSTQLPLRANNTAFTASPECLFHFLLLQDISRFFFCLGTIMENCVLRIYYLLKVSAHYQCQFLVPRVRIITYHSLTVTNSH